MIRILLSRLNLCIEMPNFAKLPSIRVELSSTRNNNLQFVLNSLDFVDQRRKNWAENGKDYNSRQA